MMDVKEFEDLNRKIAKAKECKAQLDGQIQALLKQIKDEFGEDSLEGAEQKIQEMQADCDDLETSLEDLDKKLREVFQW